MNREVSRFLLESWQLFYWSFFCPSKLKQRMNEWSPQETKQGNKRDTFGIDILLLSINFKFVFQYLLIVIIFSLPLLNLIVRSGQILDWIIWPINIFTSYCILGFYLLPSGIGFCSPLLLGLGYWLQSKLLRESSIQYASQFVRFAPHLSFSIVISIVALFVNFLLVLALLNKNFIRFAHYTLWVGSGLSILLGIGVTSRDWFIPLILSMFTSFLSFLFRNKIDYHNRTKYTAINMAFTLLFLILFILLYGLVNSATFIFLQIAYGPLYCFLIACILVSFGLAPLKREWLGIWISIFFVLIGIRFLTFSAFWAIPVSLIFYYRILPDYLLALLTSLPFVEPFISWFSLQSTFFLTKLPPYTTEILWLPLPNHANILINTFNQNTELGGKTLEKMQIISLPGFKSTIKKALPLIIAEQLTVVSDVPELINSVAFAHSIFPKIIPAFYQSNKEINLSLAPLKSDNPEINLLFPRFQQIAKDIVSASQNENSTLRDRSLGVLVDQLKILPSQLPGFALNSQAVERWEPAIKRWQNILELEIAEQRKIFQGELFNPFQFGNPLHENSNTIFKGRQAFADQLVRLILDRNRPTLVLHGPRRSGKTSFLLNLPRLLPSDLIPIYLDVQQGSMTDSEGDFCYGLVRAIQRDARSQGLIMPDLPIRQKFVEKPYPTLEDWLDSALSQIGERRLLLNLDEFEKIGSAIKEQRISDRLFDQLRSMIQHDDRLGFLFSGVQTLEELGPRWSNYFISVVPMEMHYLEPAEAEDLLLNPDPEFTLRYDPGIVDEILHLTRCQPYLLQLIGFALVTEANRQQTQTATTELLQAAIQNAFTNGEPYFTNIWTEFTGTTPSEVAAGQNLLLALARRNSQSPIICNAATTAANRRLLRYHVIERINENIDRNQADATWETAHYHIEIPLFEQWVKERAIKI
jgi:AAA+ ATPase superfamily predicted ATPase